MKKSPPKINPLIVALVGFIIFVGITFVVNSGKKNLHERTAKAPAYNPNIRPKEFTTEITNTFFSLPVGKKMTYLLETDEGLEKTEIQILNKYKMIMGVKTIAYWDRVWLDINNDNKFSGNELIEETYDYLAQDKIGNVWYFGEEVDNYKNGKLVDHEGSWLAGRDISKIGTIAQPGIWIKASHKVGDSYRQEFYEGEAEDMRDVIATGITVKTKMKTFTDCVQMYDWTPLESDAREYKYYCPEVAAMVVAEHLDEQRIPVDRTELISMQNDNKK